MYLRVIPTSQLVEVLGDKIQLKDPKRDGGIMRYFQNTDFEANNYQFIEFWVLNPFWIKVETLIPAMKMEKLYFSWEMYQKT